MSRHLVKPRCALISVADKTGLIDFAKRLSAQNISILSTGGTAAALRESGIAVTDVSAHTNFPEIMAGRVKTLHPIVHGGILGRRGIDDEVMQQHNIAPIDLVVVNLYPFTETIAQADVTLEQAIEQIDVGGPTMVRAAAKNHQDVGIVVSPADYPAVMTAIEHNNFDLALRQSLALKAFTHTADYDRAISAYLSQTFDLSPEHEFPSQLNLHYQLAEPLRYGENPHQQAAFYKSRHARGANLASAKQLQGKALSYNNYADADTALSTVLRFQEDVACVIVKHANPCGVAVGDNALQAYDAAQRCDATSAFGGIIAFNRSVTKEVAHEILSRQFLEVLIAPSYTESALEILKQKPNVRVLQVDSNGYDSPDKQITSIHGGVLVQDWDYGLLKQDDLQVVSEREPSNDELNDLLFAWRVVKAVKSNAIVLAKNQATIGIGAGQTSRVYSSRIAVMKAQDEGLETQGAALASDAFFPFRDGVDTAAAAGVSAIIQPGGSMRDQEVIDAANEHNIAMIFTGIRHFRH